MAGTIRSQYPTSIRAVKVRCLGIVHPDYILRALCKGADGVLLIG